MMEFLLGAGAIIILGNMIFMLLTMITVKDKLNRDDKIVSGCITAMLLLLLIFVVCMIEYVK